MALCLRLGRAQTVTEDLGVCQASLYHWRDQLLSNEALESMKVQHGPPPSSERDELARELESLRP